MNTNYIYSVFENLDANLHPTEAKWENERRLQEANPSEK
jgi:hypothetical protein